MIAGKNFEDNILGLDLSVDQKAMLEAYKLTLKTPLERRAEKILHKTYLANKNKQVMQKFGGIK